MWSKYGVNGKDGDGVEYIYKLNNTGVAGYRGDRSICKSLNLLEMVWTDNPLVFLHQINMSGFVFVNLEMVFGENLAILFYGLNMEIMDKQVIVLEQCIAKLEMLVLFHK